ncbi:hypothetical protein C6Y02_16860 [Bacillus sp. NMCC4]|uniref:hypothetical protein n=1 Tax=Bacillus sp. NMCC4 TaxID=2108539 RepID=UPI000D0243F0|nr:hypothetical protein [Bacillus sp. NMCC4]PRS35684.1 hypothetical protein C6Y02_16860 [Bacillus sp. NMCC4]
MEFREAFLQSIRDIGKTIFGTIVLLAYFIIPPAIGVIIFGVGFLLYKEVSLWVAIVYFIFLIVMERTFSLWLTCGIDIEEYIKIKRMMDEDR